MRYYIKRWKRLISIILIITLVGPNMPWGVTKIFADDVVLPFTGGGTGIVTDPYVLKCEEDFILLQEETAKSPTTNAFTGVYFKIDSYADVASGSAIGVDVASGAAVDSGVASGTAVYASVASGSAITVRGITNSENTEDDSDEEEEYDLTPDIDLTQPITVDGEEKLFTGIGDESHYFCGNIAGGGTRIKTNTPLFNFLGNNATIEKMTLLGDITNAYNPDSSMGALAIAVLPQDEGGEVTITDILVKANVTGGKYSTAGLIGVYRPTRSTTLNLANIRIDGTITNIESSSGAIGGLIGFVDSMYTKDTDYVSVNIIGTTTIRGNYINNNKNTAMGGLIGSVTRRVDVGIDGTVDLSKMNELSGEVSLTGYLFGKLEYSYVHQSETASIILPSDYIKNKAGEVGTGGTVYHNPIINALEDPTVMLSGKGTVADPYQLTNPNDYMILAITLNTQGDFAKECFDTSSKLESESAYDYLLGANYRVANSVDLSATGILRLNLPFVVGNERDGFHGTFCGYEDAEGNRPTITVDMNTKQTDVGLFAYVTTPSTTNNNTEYMTLFNQFNMDGNIQAGTNAASVYAKGFVLKENGGKIAVTNLSSSVSIVNTLQGSVTTEEKYSMRLNPGNATGGLCGMNSLVDCTKEQGEFVYDNISYSGTITGYEGFFGGLLGYYCAPYINDATKSGILTINNYKFSGKVESLLVNPNDYSRISGCVSWIAGPPNSWITSCGMSYSVYYNKTKVNCSNITFENATLSSIAGDTNISGGLLGWEWHHVDANVSNVEVKDSLIETTGYVGGLLYNIYGKIYIKDTSYDTLLINQKNGSRGLHSGMIRVGSQAIIDIDGFKATNSGIITTNSYFHDLVGDNTANRLTTSSVSSYNSADRFQSGILNVRDSADYGQYYSLVDTASSSYHIYYNQMGLYQTEQARLNNTKKAIYNARTRVHYNLYKDWDKEENRIRGTGTKTDPFIIDNETKMMMLYVFNTVTLRERYQYLEYFKDHEAINIGTASNKTQQEKDAAYIEKIRLGYFIITSDLDMSAYSSYPMPVIGGKYYGFDLQQFKLNNPDVVSSDSEIIKSAVNQFANDIEPSDGDMDYSNYKPSITFNAAKIIAKAVANDNKYLQGITNPNHWQGYHVFLQGGLFCNVVSLKNTTVEFNNLQLEGSYSCVRNQEKARDVWGTGGALVTKVPYFWSDSTLEGQNYSINRANVKISNIAIGNLQGTDFACTNSSIDNTGTSIFGTGLLLCDIYNSKVSIDGISIVEESTAYADALIGAIGGEKTSVTFEHIKLGQGAENKVKNFNYASLVYNYSSGIASYNYDTQDIHDKNITLNTEKPYAFKKLAILVNPMSADIIEGDGTKNNPFVIDSAEQLLTLSTFLLSEGLLPPRQQDSQYNPADPNWYVGDYRNNSAATNMLEQDNILETLRTAHYVLSNDIDFNQVTDVFKDAAWDFAGIGTQSQPFAGVFDGNNKTIILSQKGLTTNPNDSDIDSTVTDYETYGLFAYIKGATIKNIVFEDSSNYSNWYKKGSVVTAGGSVASYVIGGDNIIEDVVLNNTFYIKKDGTTVVGGYIGEVRGGTVLVRNTEDSMSANPVNGFRIYRTNSATPASDEYSASMIGKVMNGVVIYDGYEDSTVAAVPYSYSVFQNNMNLSPSRTTGIVNKAYLDQINKIAITYDSSQGYSINLEDEKQMFLAAITLNSGSFSTYSSLMNECYYDKVARTKKVDSTEDAFNRPFLYQYYSFNGGLLSDTYATTQSDSGTSYLNPTVNNDLLDTSRRTTYYLTATSDYVYDLTKDSINTVFHGFGGMTDIDNPYSYFVDNASAPTLRANFDGNNHKVKACVNNSYNSQTSGLFNDLYVRYKSTSTSSFQPYEIRNLTIEGEFGNKEVFDNGPNPVKRAGAIAGGVFGSYLFSNVTVQDTMIKAINYAGGIVGRHYTASNYTFLTFKDCSIVSTDSLEKPMKIIGQYAGGIVGYVNNANTTFEGIRIQAVDISPYDISKYCYLGGVIGQFSATQGYVSSRVMNDISIFDTKIHQNNSTQSRYYAGGLIGYCSGNWNADNCIYKLVMKNNSITGNINYCAKLVGFYEGYGNVFVIKPTITYEEGFTGDIPSADVKHAVNTNVGHVYSIYMNPFEDLAVAEESYGINREDQVYNDLIATDIFNGEEDFEGKMLVKYSAKSGMIQDVMNSILDTLTNKSATLESDVKDHIKIDTVKMVVTDSVAKEVLGELSSISVEQVAGKSVFVVNHYDTKDVANKNGTYTAVKFIYTFGDYTEEIIIPVYVDNMIDTDVYTKIMVGKINNPESFKSSTQSKITVTNDSSYTMYCEYVYGSLRLAYDVSDMVVNKNFTFTDNVALSKGTKLTLIDLTVDNEPRVYYYTVDKKNIMQVRLEEFKDANGIAYVSRDITKASELPSKATYTTMTNKRKRNVGVERYLLQVDNSGVDINTANMADTKFRPRIESGVADNQALSALFIRERFAVELTTIEGRYIRLKEDSVATEGSINRNVTLRLDATFLNQANETYRNRAMSTDSVNNGKYLDVAVYLLNDLGEKILFPVGTMIKTKENASYQAISNTSVIYYYKDCGMEYALSNSDINDEVALTMEFSFATAKMETLPPGNYRLGVDLIRTSDKKYPFGGEKLDSAESELFKVTASAMYGIAIHAKDYNELAINKMESDNTEYPMNFTMDLSSTLSKEQLQTINTTNIEVGFDIYKKDAITGEYREVSLEQDPIIQADFNGADAKEKTGVHVAFEFNLDNFKASSELNNYVKKPFTVIFPSNVAIGNYKIVAGLRVEGVTVASDYIIANIADINLQE